MLHRIDSTVNADEELASASAAVEEEVAGPVRQGMEGGIDITTGTAVPSMKGVITVGEEVLDENGAPTGTYNVDVNGEAAVMSEDEMRSAYDEFKARVDEERAVAAERGRSEREAARSEEEYRQQVGVGDDVTFVRDGKRISDRAVMDYDEDSLIVDVEDGARTRSYNVRREEIVAPGNAVEEEETPAVDDNAVQEDDVQTDTGNAQAQAQEETEAPVTPEETGAAETAAPAHADNGTTTSSPSTDAVVGGQETHAPAQAPAPSVQAEQQSPANGNVVTPAADTATVQRESGNAHTNGTAPAQAPASAQDIVSDRNTPMPINEDTGEPDYARATPERTREFLYNESGLEADEADAYVGNNAEQAREELEKAKESKPKMEKGKTLTQFLSEKAAWQQQMDEAQRNVDYWEGVKNAGQETATNISSSSDIVSEQDMDAAPSGESTQETPTLTHKEAISLISQMEEQAHVAPEIELTIENWDALFGEEGKVSTPIGEVKMGENQFTKLMRQGRNGKLGMIKPTLENPDVIIEDASEAKDGDLAERNSSYIFVKAFKKADGSRYYYFTSITVSKGGREVVVSSQEKSRNRLLRLMTEGKILWRTPKDATTASVEQQGLDYAQPSETETATKGSGVTPQSTDVYPSADKVSESSVPDKNNGEKVSENQQEGAGNVENNAPEASLRNGRKAGNAKNDILNDEQKKMLDSIGRALGIRVELVDGLGANGECDPAEWFRVACIYTWVNVNLNLDD